MANQQVGLHSSDREPVVQGNSIPYDVHCIQSGRECLWIDPPVKNSEDVFEHGHERVFYTHMPWGRGVQSESDEILLGQDDLYVIRSSKNIQPCFWREGYPKNEQFPMKASLKQDTRVQAIGNDERFFVGKCEVRCIHTPGPTPGHTCLYLPQEQILFTGVLLAQPSKMNWLGHEPRALERLLKSLEEIKELPVKQFFPVWDKHTSLKERTEYVARNCYFRVLELLRLVQDHPGLTAYELAGRFSRMEKEWTEISPQQKLEAMEETLAYLTYLRDRDYVRGIAENGRKVNVPGKRRLTDIV